MGEAYASNMIKQAEASSTWPSWKSLFKKIKKLVYAGDLKEEALKKLEACKQCRRGTINFVQEFTLLKGQTGVSDNFAKHLLERAMDYSILEKIYNGSLKETFSELLEAIVHYGDAQDQLHALHSPPNTSTSSMPYREG